MIMHPGHRCNHVALSQQEIPASDHCSSCVITNLTGCLESRMDLSHSIQLTKKALNPMRHPPEVLPAQFKLHKPPQSWRLPSSRCI
jgi:hypothetical protein